MVEKRTCDYTGEEIEPGTGIMYVQNDGSVLHFVDSKAEKNYKLGREPRDLEWTEEGRAGKAPTETDEEAEQDEALETEDEAVDEDDDSEPTDDEDAAEGEADAEEATESESNGVADGAEDDEDEPDAAAEADAEEDESQ
ncbi:50S ribosomal protein L24e [Natronobacterium gregoryi]|uniref:Large ribosomal subunit protein eL24 n=2 Tax=Natronobacterium gregoryi TaxID=44930 RepID=L0AJW2_NATGS|nr:50S ribosomal protein L24e [Natronobacterium gregoryi]AFZ73734.1 ribosomal protein L24E [Natronobacterium gregoryi SP2]ELY65793.1 50S ribosomal protein L24E [Natronobacterium gregoryi SP2]PLK19459.1 50S ribosomal protein L24e [Natronobacterium gregoryi SP2]SFJ47926.1 large subunit ribosomal protein L24e [Natronobacterium gregoryi]